MPSSLLVASHSVVLPVGLAPGMADAAKMADTCVVSPALVRVEGSLITSVERHPTPSALDSALDAAQGTATEKDVEIVDARNRILAPAFVNAHTHLCMNVFRAFPTRAQTAGNLIEDLFFRVESELEAADVRAFARLGALECLASGTALVWDHYYHSDAVADALRDTGLCGVVAPTIQDVGGPGVGGAEAAFDLTLALHRDRAAAGRGIFAAFGPHATDTVSRAFWERLAEAAFREAIPIHAHVAQSPEEFERVLAREGSSPVGVLERAGALRPGVPLLAVHAIYATRSDLTLLSRAPDARLVLCPYSQLVFHFPAAAGVWEKAGVRWCVATDCAASNDSMAVQKEVRYVAGLAPIARSHGDAYAEFLSSRSRAGAARAAARLRRERAKGTDLAFSDDALFAKVTSLPGRAHPRFRAGVIAPGALANLALWRPGAPSLWPVADPLRNLLWCDPVGALDGLLSAGRWVSPPGVSPAESFASRADIRDMVAEADARLVALARRAGVSGLQFRQARVK